MVSSPFSTNKVAFVLDASVRVGLFSTNSLFEEFSTIFGKVSFLGAAPGIEEEGLTIFVVGLFLSKIRNLVKVYV